MKKELLVHLFRCNADTKSIYEAGNMITEIPAMTEDKFVKVVTKILNGRIFSEEKEEFCDCDNPSIKSIKLEKLICSNCNKSAGAKF